MSSSSHIGRSRILGPSLFVLACLLSASAEQHVGPNRWLAYARRGRSTWAFAAHTERPPYRSPILTWKAR